MKKSIKYIALLWALSVNATMYSQNGSFAIPQPKDSKRIIVTPKTDRQNIDQRSVISHIDAYYEDGSIYITMWGEGELVEVEVCNTTNGDYLVMPAEGCYSVVNINDMGCGEYTLLIYCDNNILYTGDFTL